MPSRVYLFLVTLLSLACFLAPIHGEEVLETIAEAQEYYQAQDYPEAISSLEYAAQLIRQQRGEQLENYLPQPLAGWTAKKASSQAVGGAVLGGAVTAERTYVKDTSSVKISMVTDSPMMQAVMMMFNPMIATASGSKLKRIGGEKVLIEYDEENLRGEIKAVAAKRVLVTISGTKVSKEDLEAHAAAIPFKKLKTAF